MKRKQVSVLDRPWTPFARAAFPEHLHEAGHRPIDCQTPNQIDARIRARNSASPHGA